MRTLLEVLPLSLPALLRPGEGSGAWTSAAAGAAAAAAAAAAGGPAHPGSMGAAPPGAPVASDDSHAAAHDRGTAAPIELQNAHSGYARGAGPPGGAAAPSGGEESGVAVGARDGRAGSDEGLGVREGSGSGARHCGVREAAAAARREQRPGPGRGAVGLRLPETLSPGLADLHDCQACPYGVKSPASRVLAQWQQRTSLIRLSSGAVPLCLACTHCGMLSGSPTVRQRRSQGGGATWLSQMRASPGRHELGSQARPFHAL